MLRYSLLEMIHDGDTPLTVQGSDEINDLRRYVAAGLVTAQLPMDTRFSALTTEAFVATVISLTPEGRRTVQEVRRKRFKTRSKAT